MAGTQHTLRFAPQGADVDITMASSHGMPLQAKFQEAHSALAHLKAYMGSIQDTTVRKKFQAKFGGRLGRIEQSDVAAYKTIYKQVFPHRALESDKQATATQSAKGSRSAGQSCQETSSRHRRLGGGARGSRPQSRRNPEHHRCQGEGDLGGKVLEIKSQVDKIVSGFSYRGQQLQYVGSMSRGYRDPHKGLTRFNIKDFDVDLHVVDPVEFARVAATGVDRVNPKIVDKNKVFPTEADTPELLDLSKDILKTLKKMFPEVKGISDTTIVLRKSAPTALRSG